MWVAERLEREGDALAADVRSTLTDIKVMAERKAEEFTVAGLRREEHVSSAATKC
jgi:hypothetical protein